MSEGELIAANYVSAFYVYIFIHKIQVVWGVIFDLLNQGVETGGIIRKNLIVSLWMRSWID
jgi:hypothetical protein